MPLSVAINGQSRTFDTLTPPATLAQVIAELNLKGDRIAVEHNGEIAPRASWTEISVGSGDRLEVVHFVGGGNAVESAATPATPAA
jgi:sulfur carrier protein